MNTTEEASPLLALGEIFEMENFYSIKEVLEQYRKKLRTLDTEYNDLKSALQKVDGLMNQAKLIQRGDRGTPGKDGISPSITDIVNYVLKVIKLPKDGKNGEDGRNGTPGKDGISPIVDEDSIAGKVLKLLLKTKLEIDHIKGLENRLNYLTSKMMLGGGGGGQGSWKQKQLSGDINGVNTVFTFAGDPPTEYSERVFLNYIEQNPFTDYTISGTTITYTTAPDASLSGLPHIIRFM